MFLLSIPSGHRVSSLTASHGHEKNLGDENHCNCLMRMPSCTMHAVNEQEGGDMKERGKTRASHSIHRALRGELDLCRICLDRKSQL